MSFFFYLYQTKRKVRNSTHSLKVPVSGSSVMTSCSASTQMLMMPQNLSWITLKTHIKSFMTMTTTNLLPNDVWKPFQRENDGESNLSKEVILEAERQPDMAEHDELSVRKCVWISTTRQPLHPSPGIITPGLNGDLASAVYLSWLTRVTASFHQHIWRHSWHPHHSHFTFILADAKWLVRAQVSLRYVCKPLRFHTHLQNL